MKLPKVSLGLLLVLLFVFLLRLPSFWEPHWYGDEEIYLALGQAMQRGAVLYRDIWDNKPPLLYILYAIHPTLLFAKITATLFVLGTCVGVYLLAKKIFFKRSTGYCLLTTALAVILLWIPRLECTIANSELYFTLPIFKDKMVGITSGAYYALDYKSPENKRLTERYYAKYGKKKLMNSDVASGYEGMKFICTALGAIRGKVEDTEAFLKAMHDTKIKGVVSSAVSVDANGNVVRDFLILQVQKKDGVVKNVVLDVFPQVHQPPQGYTVMPGK